MERVKSGPFEIEALHAWPKAEMFLPEYFGKQYDDLAERGDCWILDATSISRPALLRKLREHFQLEYLVEYSEPEKKYSLRPVL